MAKFKRETSSGGILYRTKNNRNIEIALISRITQRGNTVWCLPKGKVENDETPEETALREVKEETGMEGELGKKLGHINYWFYDPEDKVKVFKTVYFYLMAYKSGNFQNHDWEVENVRWFDINKAMEFMAYKTEKEIVEKAREELQYGSGGDKK